MTVPNSEVEARELPASSRAQSRSRFGGIDGSRVATDALALLVVPLVMAGVFTLPTEIKRAYAFSYTEPTVVTAFTAHYVHLTLDHLVGNLTGFFLLASLAYGLSLVGGRRRLFFASMATFLIAFPFVLSGLNLAIPRNAIGFGFSGINMALFGYVAVALVTVVGDRFEADTCRYLPALFLASAGYVAVHALPVSAASVGLASVALAVAIPFGRFAERHSTQSLRRTVAQALDTPVYGELFAVSVVILLGYPFVGFPTPTPGGPRVNIYIHFLGYALAYTVVYVSLLADRSDRLL
ncbi:hypothetical protein [Halorubrum sp. AJ67]|uniref:hypothetical protein n=1 Tax=Halorubrum sp. AJ67 TaxID=1173487 RepID=UPI000693C511|nr:hypothetical protein [Halorubrum sp. AJ67]